MLVLILRLEILETIFTPPNDTTLEEIYTKEIVDNTKCSDSNQWTSWKSVTNPSNNNGNDYETLRDHQKNLSNTLF